MFDITRLGQWQDLPFFHNELKHVEADLENETAEILPPISQVFAALELCQPKETRVVILGQDPYPTPGHAHGLAFSAEPHVTPLPRSLANIYRELADDIGARPKTADLRPWAEQGASQHSANRAHRRGRKPLKDWLASTCKTGAFAHRSCSTRAAFMGQTRTEDRASPEKSSTSTN